MNPKVDEYLNKLKKWQEELEILRAILIDCMLTEEFKWRVPCYTFNNKNVILLANFKDYCAISFLKGVLLKDTENLLISPGENSQSVKYLKFTNPQEIQKLTPIIKSYIYEAIEIEKAGLKVDLKKSTDFELVEELQEKLKENSKLNTAFNALTPGRKRAYNLFFSGAKQSKTRISRIEKYEERILNGKGINDCVCGLSKRMPNCDGSHKYIKK
ncbi:DUF1801 domain-containing protein [Wenyingzhuangia fucanilytica]|uniref:DUF1801 domain-containing protein n=1 Tax=Wenyingzhuangia fucanilytica TaxID=1790137 RepID=UPI00083A2D15|nr:DUF1801 domain-containing protein [Wenyingzhuangia fucanilytica]